MALLKKKKNNLKITMYMIVCDLTNGTFHWSEYIVNGEKNIYMQLKLRDKHHWIMKTVLIFIAIFHWSEYNVNGERIYVTEDERQAPLN